jgi:sortase (surface protein transpeptidase)
VSDEQRGRRTRRIAMVAAALLVRGGAAAVTVGLTSQVQAPQPPASAAHTAGVTTPAAPPSSSSPGPSAPTLPPAQPTHVEIPAISVSSDLLQLGRNADGTVQVPPLAKDSKAGWYRYSPTPGELGPAVLLGHVDSAAYGPGVFFKLGALRAGDTVAVTRADHSVATFRVTRVASYPKDDFPTLAVYGNTDDAELRLITCGGAFDSSARSYLNNIVVYAVLVGSTPG